VLGVIQSTVVGMQGMSGLTRLSKPHLRYTRLATDIQMTCRKCFIRGTSLHLDSISLSTCVPPTVLLVPTQPPQILDHDTRPAVMYLIPPLQWRVPQHS